MSVMKNLINNPWIIGIGSGCLVALIIKMITHFMKNISTKRSILDLTPEKIYEEIDKVPDLQKKDKKKYYKGFLVKWEGYLNKSQFWFPFYIMIELYSDKNSYSQDFHCLLNVIKYRKMLSIYNKGTKFAVMGKIDFYFDTIELHNCEILSINEKAFNTD